MPILFHKILSPGNFMAVWHITEPKEILQKHVNENYSEMAFKERAENVNAIHFLASRALLSNLFPNQSIELIKNEFNKPSLWVNQRPYFISISHSFDYAAILVSENHEVGIDIERIDPRITRVKHKFLNELELSFAGEDSQTELQTLIWSAKESVYKVYGLKSLDFKKNMQISPFAITENGSFDASLQKESLHVKLKVQYLKIENYYITFALHPFKNHDLKN